MPETPYQARILAGAIAYSAPDGIKWGDAEENLLVNVGAEWKGYGRIDNPPWPKNGKVYWVDLNFLEPFVPPIVSSVVPTSLIVELSDGSIWVATQFTRLP